VETLKTADNMWEDERDNFVFVCDHFLKCVITQVRWGPNFEKGTCDFWKVVSKCDLGYMLYILEKKLPGWWKEFEEGEKPEGRATAEANDSPLYREWCHHVTALAESHGEVINREYTAHRLALRALNTEQDIDRPKKKAKTRPTTTPHMELDFIDDSDDEEVPTQIARI